MSHEVAFFNFSLESTHYGTTCTRISPTLDVTTTQTQSPIYLPGNKRLQLNGRPIKKSPLFKGIHLFCGLLSDGERQAKGRGKGFSLLGRNENTRMVYRICNQVTYMYSYSDHHDTLKKVSVTIPILCSKFVSDTIFDTFFQKKYPIHYRYFFDTLAAKNAVV